MSGDFSRDSFDALRDFAGTFLQQGRAVLDSDWNELVEIFERRIRAGTVDTIGRAVVPRETPHGFEIQVSASSGIEIGRGRLYLDGLLVECHGVIDYDAPLAPDRPVFDRGRVGTDGPEGVLDEIISPPSGDFVPYDQQPYWPVPEPLPGNGTHLIYLVAWQRAVTPTEDPGLLEPALGGLDTTTRWQTVWQVRVFPNVDPSTTCSTPDDQITDWSAAIAPSTARLTTGTIDIEDPEDPCLVPPTEGYTGLENQFYRVEVHSVGTVDDNGNPPTQGDARFKFSRENASVRSSVSAIASDGLSVTMGRIGRDEVLRFRPGDWVEITDDRRELDQQSGQMLRVAEVDEDTREVVFESAVDATLIPSGTEPDTLANRHTRLIRWDQAGIVRLDDGTEWEDLDADTSDGLIPVPPDGRAIVLESGITVSFSTAAGAGLYREMDHWRFAARTAGTQIKILREAPPDGVQRHYARLAVVRPETDNPLSDCRVFWPPEFGGEGCACTVCVTAEGHNSGALTIQAAIDQVGSFGGTVCLEGGLYVLSAPINIASRAAIRLSGQGLGTILVYQGQGGAIRVETGMDVSLERFTVLAAPAADPNGGLPPVHGVAAHNTGLLALKRLALVTLAANPEDRFDFAIALDGVQLGTVVEECLAVGAHAIGSRSSYGQEEEATFVAFAELRVTDCILFGGRDAVRFDGPAMNIAATRFTRDMVVSFGAGMRVNLAEIPAASFAVEASTIITSLTALNLSAGTTRVTDCEISGGDQAGDGIFLAPNILPTTRTDVQIVGNTIFDLAGAGIRIAGLHDTIFIKRNILRDIGQAGIVMTPDAAVRHIAVDNNQIERIAITSAAQLAVGVALTAAESGQVVGNSIRGVGFAGLQGQAYAGIAVQGVGSVDISDNVLTDIGGRQAESTSAGVLAQPPFIGLTVAQNRIIGELATGGDAVDWQAIRIGPPIEDQQLDGGNLPRPALGFLTAIPAFAPLEQVHFVVSGQIYAASQGRFAVALPAASSQIAATANQARAGQSLLAAMVSIVDTNALGITAAQNQVDLRSGGGLREVMLLGAARVAAAGNQVTHATDAVSLRIVTGGRTGAAPVGNVTSAAVAVHPGGLGSFANLNVQA